MTKDYQISKIQMSEKDQEAWLRAMAELCIEMFIEEQQKLPPDIDTTHTPKNT